MKVDLFITKVNNETNKKKRSKIKNNNYKEVLEKAMNNIKENEEINIEIYFNEKRIDSFFICKK